MLSGIYLIVKYAEMYHWSLLVFTWSLSLGKSCKTPLDFTKSDCKLPKEQQGIKQPICALITLNYHNSQQVIYSNF